MGIKRTMSLKTAFWKFLVMLLLGLLGAILLPFSFIFIGTAFGVINYADYQERNIKELEPVLAATPDLENVQLPTGSKYLILDKNYQVMETSLEDEDLEAAMKYATSGQINQNLNKQYLFVTRPNEYVVIEYYIGSRYTNDWLNEHFLPPEVLLYILMGINCGIVCIVLTTKFARNLRLQLTPLFQATEQVSQQNLDFEVGHSNIKEFEDVLLSFADMKNSLKGSLEKQWKAEQLQREQIAALAHDLKTPLTVIQGNVDLISETELDVEQQLYADYIIESTEQMGGYIRTLIDISKTVAGYQLHLEKVDINIYIKQMEKQINSLCLARGIHLQMNIDGKATCLEMDKMLMERAIMNVINNALEHSPQGGTIYVSFCNFNNFLQITIEDEGEGFSQEALRHAKEQFFMDDDSRGAEMHFGMGLYIASTIIKLHAGGLVLTNSENTCGAKVIMKISVCIKRNDKRFPTG